MSTMLLIGLGLVMFSVGGILIETGRFTVTRDVSGIWLYKDKETGKEYMRAPKGYLQEISTTNSTSLPEEK